MLAEAKAGSQLRGAIADCLNELQLFVPGGQRAAFHNPARFLPVPCSAVTSNIIV
jgi:hypothetical protein